MAVCRRSKSRGHELSLRHVGCTPTLSVMKSTTAAAVHVLWHYMVLCHYLLLLCFLTRAWLSGSTPAHQALIDWGLTAFSAHFQQVDLFLSTDFPALIGSAVPVVLMGDG